MSDKKTRERKVEKRQRVGFTGHRTNLQLSKEESEAMDKSGYRPYWHIEDNIQQALNAGYEFARPDEALSIGQHELHKDNSALGDRVSVVTTKANPPIRSVLMKIKKEFYKEDEEARLANNAKVTEALRSAGGVENRYGSVEITRS